MRIKIISAVFGVLVLLGAIPEVWAWVRAHVVGRSFLLQDRRGLRYRIEYGEPFSRLAGVPTWRRNMTDDPPMLDYLERTLRPGDVVVDIGASIGAISLVAAKIGCEVLAVEAERVNVGQLTANIALNELPVTVRHAAITNYTGVASLQVFPRRRRGHHTLAGVTDAASTESVECLTIDDLLDCHGIEHVDLLKIDIEGAEPEAWQGAQRSFAEGRIDRVVFEISRDPLERAGHRIDDVVAPLRAAGFTIQTFDGDVVTGIPQVRLANLVAVASLRRDTNVIVQQSN